MTSTFMIHHLTFTLTYTTLLNITYNHTKCIHNVNIIQYTGCAKKKKDILNIHIKSEGIIMFSQKFC